MNSVIRSRRDRLGPLSLAPWLVAIKSSHSITASHLVVKTTKKGREREKERKKIAQEK